MKVSSNLKNHSGAMSSSGAISAPDRRVGRLAAIAGALTATAGSAPAMAQSGGQNLGMLAQGWNSQFTNVGHLILNGATVIGAVIAGGGLLEMKRAHDPENQGRATPKSAGTKMAVGGGLAALSMVINAATSTVFSGGGSNAVSQGSINFNG